MRQAKQVWKQLWCAVVDDGPLPGVYTCFWFNRRHDDALEADYLGPVYLIQLGAAL